MRNPLTNRYLRELKSDFGKYFIIFIFITGMVSIFSGYLISCNSIDKTLKDAHEVYNIEDGNFETLEALSNKTIDNLQKESLSIYENFYKEAENKENNSIVRVYKLREIINKAHIMSGTLPSSKDEIVLDRLYAKNNNISIGDTITLDGNIFKITGFVALSDYTSLYRNNTDMMFDSIKFSVALTTDSGFNSLDNTNIHYNYSWLYHTKPSDEDSEIDRSEDFLEVLNKNTVLLNYIPKYLNLAIIFAADDVGKDSSIMKVFLYIIMSVLAFVIGVTTSANIVKESNVIGTLRASGYSRKEILLHYITLPIVVILTATIIGNILGYTFFKTYTAIPYYNSYSLPPYKTIFNMDALIFTSIIPVVFMILIISIILYRKLKLSPLKFIHRDLSTRKNRILLPLSSRLNIFSKFRIRIIFQNISSYSLIFIGVFLANFIMLFGFLFAPLLDNYSDIIVDNTISKYQYILKAEVETDNPNVEKYCASSLHDVNVTLDNEHVMIYGIEANSKYIDIDSNKVYISDSYSMKYNIKVGDTITLEEIYDDKEYKLKVGGIYSYPSTISVFMNIDKYRELFDCSDSYYNGYFSTTEITDIDESYISTIITEDDLVKVSRQLKKSMSGIMNLVVVFGVIVFILLIYLLSKIVLDKNSQNISLTKILGYSNGEINMLYIMTNSIVTIISLLITFWIANYLLEKICYIFFSGYPQYFPYYMPIATFIKTTILGIVSYSIIAFFQIRKAKKIPLNLALKNIE